MKTEYMYTAIITLEKLLYSHDAGFMQELIKDKIILLLDFPS
jgi:hypothetical protein